ncbi:hypothetical protein [Sphingobacterium sp. WOUb80]|uniref:hypothetical protein n=1 Tax=Sphingobacterium sp. WOUb80 TaxID=3234028 RepID=UPI003CE85835
MFNFFKKNKPDIQEEWNAKGEQYASEINKMVEFGKKNGWDNWKGEEPQDNRDHLANEILNLLRAANLNQKTEQFRESFPPAHAPFIPFLEKQGQSIEMLHFIDKQKIAFLTGTSYQKRQAYILDNEKLLELEDNITAIGKSKRGNIFAIAVPGKISTYNGWEGTLIGEFILKETAEFGITELIPFNDGRKILLVTSEGIYLIDKDAEKLIHPLNENNDEDWSSNIDMENATLSNDNTFIVAGDQCYDHTIMDAEGTTLGNIGPQSSYPHFCLFSHDDAQLITNSCHFYNGITIGIDTVKLKGINIEPYSESDQYNVIDDNMRVYVGIAIDDYYILGDAYGYIKAIDKNGKKLWQHFLGSTISGITASDDGLTLWAASCSGMIHKLLLGKGHRDKHTIGDGNHYEDFRLLIWKGESQPLKW